jgi:hypothetical protein
MKTSSGRMVKCWISKIYLTNPSIEPSTLLFSPATQTCCSEGEGGLEFFDEEFYAMCCLGCRSCGVMESSVVLFH